MAGKFLDNDGLARFKENMIQEVEARMGMPLGFEYFQTNPNVRAGSLPLTGGLYSRTIYADLWAWIQSQDGYLISETEWQAKAEANGGAVPFYSDGDGSTTFRVPALTVWCKGTNGDEAIGDYLADTFASHKHNVSVTSSGSTESAGVHTHNILAGWPKDQTSASGVDVIEYDQFNENRGFINDAYGTSRLIEDAGAHTHSVTITNTVTESSQGNEETRPKTIIGLYCVIAFCTVASVGSVNLEDVQQAIDALPTIVNCSDQRERDSSKPTYGL